VGALLRQRADSFERVSAVRDEDAGEFTRDCGHVFTGNPAERFRLPLQEDLGRRFVLASLGIVIHHRLNCDPLANLILKQLQLGFDYLQIYAQRNNGGYILTDDGYVLQDLLSSGCALDSTKRQALLKMTLSGFGVRLEDGRLEVKASPDNFALRKHNLVQAMLAVNDLFFVASPVVSSKAAGS
jgi:hypothetical protein